MKNLFTSWSVGRPSIPSLSRARSGPFLWQAGSRKQRAIGYRLLCQEGNGERVRNESGLWEKSKIGEVFPAEKAIVYLPLR